MSLFGFADDRGQGKDLVPSVYAILDKLPEADAQLANSCLRLTTSPRPATAGHVDPREIHGPDYAEAPDKFPDARRLMRLGWRPRYPLEETIRAVLGHMRMLDVSSLRRLAALDAARREEPTGVITATPGLSAAMETLPAARSLL